MFCCFQIDKEQAELAQANFSILRKEAQAILDLVGSYFFLHCCAIRTDQKILKKLVPFLSSMQNII